jgi:hypothetical protein
MRHRRLRALLGLGILCGLSTPARPDVVADLGRADQALARRDLQAASAAYRRAFEAKEASLPQRQQALLGLVGAAVESGRIADLLAYVDQRRAQVPDDQRSMLLLASVLGQKARDGHLHRALAQLEALEDKQDAYAARHIIRDIRGAWPAMEREAQRQAAEMIRQATARKRLPKPRRRAGERAPRLPDLPAPARPDYNVALEHLTPPRPARRRGVAAPIRIAPPQVPRLGGARADRVTKPSVPPARARNLASAFFSHFYRRATELAAQGQFDAAKAEYAMVLQLFPGTPQAQQSARYAIRLFEQQRGADQGADALVAYLAWIREVLGPEGSDYAEYLAFQRFGRSTSPAILAREAEAFVGRHPESPWTTGVRIQLAIALDGFGELDRAIATLKPIAMPPEDKQRVQAAHLLAWLYIFQGEGARAEPLLQALASQNISPSDAASARALLIQVKEHPPAKAAPPLPVGAEPPKEILAERLLSAADALLRDGDPERAMDLYALYLQVGSKTPGFWAARNRIDRLKQTGRPDDE